MNPVIHAAPVNLPRFTPRGLIPTQEQTRIQLARDKVVLIEANAGAAKTTTLALRIGEALARKLAPELILALTFTPQARDVMRARLIEIGIPEASAARIAIMTFEDFAAKVLAQSEGGSARHCTQARQLKQYALAAIAQVARQHGARYDFLDLKTHHVALSQFLDVQLELKATMALQQEDLGDLEHDEAAAALNVPLTDYLATIEYERIRLGSHEEALFRGPFDATYDLACSLAEAAEQAHLPAYRLVICDELHDLNEATFRILNALLKAADCYFVGAGDKDQVIHSRLGASEQYLQHRFASSYPALARYRLTLSYRHGPHLAHAMARFKQKDVESALPLHTEIRQSHYDGASATCSSRVIEALAQWKRDKLPLDGCAILVRERHQSVAIENALMQAGIAYRTPGMPGYLQREEILFLRGMIAIALQNLAAVKSSPVRKAIVEALAIFGELEMTQQDLLEAQNMIARDPDTLRFFFSGQLVRSSSGGAGQRIASAVAYLEGVAPTMAADAVLREICSQINLETLARRIYVHPVEAGVVSKSVEGLIAAATASGMNLRDFSEWLGMAEAFTSQNRSKHQVVLDCVANAKGKEFDHVILPFLEAGEFPNPLFGRKQEENLFYVAATRARLRLTLISPLAAAQRSVFIEQMKLGAIEAGANAALATNEARAAVNDAGNTRGSNGAAQTSRHELKVPYAEKNDAKALGAEWDATRKVWHVAAGVDLKPFARWLRA